MRMGVRERGDRVWISHMDMDMGWDDDGWRDPGRSKCGLSRCSFRTYPRERPARSSGFASWCVRVLRVSVVWSLVVLVVRCAVCGVNGVRLSG
jgi:hypothetical protein